MEELDLFIQEHKKNEEKSKDFVSYLYELMDKRGVSKNSDLYVKAGISRQTWSLIISNKINPSLNSVLKLVFALELNNHE